MNEKEPIIIFDDDLTRGKTIKSSIKKENRLLQGIIIHPDSLKAAARHAGIRTMADTYRTLDRLALRKDYQQTLAKHGVDMNFIVSELKSLAMAADLDSTRLKALQVFLKSLGLDSYGKEEEGGGGWEDIVAKSIQASQSAPQLNQPYTVKPPEIPKEDIDEDAKEAQLGRSLYE